VRACYVCVVGGGEGGSVCVCVCLRIQVRACCVGERVCVCLRIQVCACYVCVKEREREKERKKECVFENFCHGTRRRRGGCTQLGLPPLRPQ
jgi:hypothetical protein